MSTFPTGNYNGSSSSSSGGTVPPTVQLKAEKGQPGGYPSLDSNGKVPDSQLPSGTGSTLPAPYTFALDSSTGKLQLFNNGVLVSSQDENGTFISTDVTTGVGSFKLGEIHSMSSAGQNVVFVNNDSGIAWFPTWQAVSSDGVNIYEATTRVFEPLQLDTQPYGAVDAVNITGFTALVNAPNNQNTAFFGFKVRAGENYNGPLTFTASLVPSGLEIIKTVFDATSWVAGSDYTLLLDYPLFINAGETVSVNIKKNNHQILQVHSQALSSTDPWAAVTYRHYADKKIFCSGDVVSIIQEIESQVGTSRLDVTKLKNLSQLVSQNFDVSNTTQAPVAAAIQQAIATAISGISSGGGGATTNWDLNDSTHAPTALTIKTALKAPSYDKTNQNQFPTADLIDPVIDQKAAAAALTAVTPTYNTGDTTHAPNAAAIQAQIASQSAAAAAGVITNVYNVADAAHAPTAGAIQPVIDAAVSQATVGRKQLGSWNASTNNPTLTTTPPSSTYQQGDFYEVSTAGTRFGITFAIGDRIVVGVNTSGNLIWFKSALNIGVADNTNLFVAAATGTDGNPGTIALPKKTIAGAYSVVSQPGGISVAIGGYTENITHTKQNITFEGKGANFNNNTQLNGTITTSAARFRMKSFQIVHNTSVGFTWGDTTGSHHFERCAFIGTGVSYTTTTAARGFASIADCDFSGAYAAANIVLPNLAAGVSNTLNIARSNSIRISIGTGWIVTVDDCPSLQVVSNSGMLVFVDGGLLNINGLLASQTALTTLLSDTSVGTDGYYICDFANPSVGSRGDVILKLSIQGVATSVLVHRPFSQAPASLALWNGASYDTIMKRGGAWVAASSGATGGIQNVTMAQRATITAAGTYYNTTVKILETCDGAGNWKPCSPVNLREYNPGSVVNVGIYIIDVGVPASLPSTSVNGAINQGDIFWFDGTNYYLLYTWTNSPSVVYVNQSIYQSGGTLYQTILKSITPLSWYGAPQPTTRDTGITFVRTISATQGPSPANPYILSQGDQTIIVDDSVGPVFLKLQPISWLASSAQIRGYTIIRPGMNVNNNVFLIASTSPQEMFMGIPNGDTQLTIQPASSMRISAVVRSSGGNVWSVDSKDSLLNYGGLEWNTLISSDLTLTKQGGLYTINATSNINITLPISSWGVGSIMFARLDNNPQFKVNLIAPTSPSTHTINGGASVQIPVGGFARSRVVATNNTALLCEMLYGPNRLNVDLTGANVGDVPILQSPTTGLVQFGQVTPTARTLYNAFYLYETRNDVNMVAADYAMWSTVGSTAMYTSQLTASWNGRKMIGFGNTSWLGQTTTTQWQAPSSYARLKMPNCPTSGEVVLWLRTINGDRETPVGAWLINPATGLPVKRLGGRGSQGPYSSANGNQCQHIYGGPGNGFGAVNGFHSWVCFRVAAEDVASYRNSDGTIWFAIYRHSSGTNPQPGDTSIWFSGWALTDNKYGFWGLCCADMHWANMGYFSYPQGVSGGGFVWHASNASNSGYNTNFIPAGGVCYFELRLPTNPSNTIIVSLCPYPDNLYNGAGLRMYVKNPANTLTLLDAGHPRTDLAKYKNIDPRLAPVSWVIDQSVLAQAKATRSDFSGSSVLVSFYNMESFAMYFVGAYCENA